MQMLKTDNAILRKVKSDILKRKERLYWSWHSYPHCNQRLNPFLAENSCLSKLFFYLIFLKFYFEYLNAWFFLQINWQFSNEKRPCIRLPSFKRLWHKVTKSVLYILCPLYSHKLYCKQGGTVKGPFSGS